MKAGINTYQPVKARFLFFFQPGSQRSYRFFGHFAGKNVNDLQGHIAYNAALLKEPIGFGIVKGDPDTVNFFNNWIEVTEAKGWFKERYNYWFLSIDWKNLIE